MRYNIFALDGVFGALMQVHIQNDGPVTLEIESPKAQPADEDEGKSKNLTNSAD